MILIVMGVSGSGKTTIGRMLAKELGWRFYEGDQFHSATSVQKMEQGIPLIDEDRWPWLERLRELIQQVNDRGESAVLACSALKLSYRERLMRNNSEVQFVYLRGDIGVIEKRLQARKKHFMKGGLLKSQFEILEEPKEAIIANIDGAPQVIVKAILDEIERQSICKS